MADDLARVWLEDDAVESGLMASFRGLGLIGPWRAASELGFVGCDHGPWSRRATHSGTSVDPHRHTNFDRQ